MLRYVACNTPQYTTVVKFFKLKKSKSLKGAVEAFSLEHELTSNNDSEDKRFSLINQKLDKLQSTCSKKFKKILDENKSLKSELSEIKTLLVGKLKANRDILFDKQPDNLQGESCPDPMVDDQYDDSTEKRSLLALLVLLVLNEDQDPRASLVVVCQGHTNSVVLDSGASLLLLFHGHDKLFFDICAFAFEEKNAGAEDLLPFPLVEEFSKSSPYSELQDFGGTKVDEDNIDETKNCGNVDSIINNVISSVFAASSSLATSPDVKNTQAERSEVGCINNDTTYVISVVDATTKFVNVDSTTCVVEISCSFYFVAIFGHNILLHEEKEKYEPNIVVKFTTTDFVFRNKIDALYHDFVKNGKDFSAILEKHEVEEYIRVFYCDANVPWNKVNFYLEKGIAKSENDTLPIRMVDELPQQTQCDCGVFVCAFAEYVIHGRDIPKEINIGHVRMRISLSGGFVIRSFMLSGTIYYAMLPTGRIYSWRRICHPRNELSKSNSLYYMKKIEPCSGTSGDSIVMLPTYEQENQLQINCDKIDIASNLGVESTMIVKHLVYE
ncbi:hypothetical protein T459_12376 [Capsicum annuum]|uniref:Ubiquitin-like protease family profile domain-containing protein n=1 Tax=Capsicum annuum TaxID=4072 RepID=A0A2G2ZPM8_CAPAN|nr:hypothetical protein T459_12376 [Capsicum annuum]